MSFDDVATDRPPRVVVCAANRVGRDLVDWLGSHHDEDVEFVATVAADDSGYEEAIASQCDEHGLRCYRRANLNSSVFRDRLRDDDIDFVVLLWVPTIVEEASIEAANIGWINLHNSYLPYGRGKHGYYWAIVDDEPFGVSIQFIDQDIDTGPILFQSEIDVNWEDTGEALYERSIQAIEDLFKEAFPHIIEWDLEPEEQGDGSFHWARELDEHSRIDLNEEYRARDLLNILRGRTFWDGTSAYFVDEGKKYHVRIDIEEVDDA